MSERYNRGLTEEIRNVFDAEFLRLPFGERMDAYTRLRAEAKITAEDVARNENMNPPRSDSELCTHVCGLTRHGHESYGTDHEFEVRSAEALDGAYEGYIDEFGDERQAVADSAVNLVIALRRWCKRKGIEPPNVDEFRLILDEAARLRLPESD